VWVDRRRLVAQPREVSGIDTAGIRITTLTAKATRIGIVVDTCSIRRASPVTCGFINKRKATRCSGTQPYRSHCAKLLVEISFLKTYDVNTQLTNSKQSNDAFFAR
jgi:hypothetical protein